MKFSFLLAALCASCKAAVVLIPLSDARRADVEARLNHSETFDIDASSCGDSWCALTAALRSPLAGDEADVPHEFSREQLRAGVQFRSVLEDVADSGLLGAGSPGRASVFYEDFPAAAMLFKGLRKAARKPMFTPWTDRRRNSTMAIHTLTSSGATYKLGAVGSGPIMLLAEPKYFNEYIAPASHQGEESLTLLESAEEFRRELEISYVRVATLAVFYHDSEAGTYKLTITRPDHSSSFESQDSKQQEPQVSALTPHSNIRTRVTCVPALLHQLAMLHWQRPSTLAVNDTVHCRPEVDSVLLELLHPQSRTNAAAAAPTSTEATAQSVHPTVGGGASGSDSGHVNAGARVLVTAAGIHSAALDNSFQRHEAVRAAARARMQQAGSLSAASSVAQPGTLEFDAALRAFADRMAAAGNRGTGPLTEGQRRIMDIAAGLGAAPSIEAFDKHIAEDEIDTELEGAMLARWVVTRWRAWDEETDGKHVVKQTKTAKEAFIEILKQRKAEEAAQRALEAERGLEDPTASEPTCKSGINSSGEGASASGNDDGAPTCRLTAAAVAADGSGDRAALNNALKAGGYSAEP